LITLAAGIALMASGGSVARAEIPMGGGGVPAPGTGVWPRPVIGTPHFSVKDSKPIEQIRQLVQCGETMYAVGSFSRIVHRGVARTRHNVFSFSDTSPFKLTKWRPKINGEVNSIAFVHGNCSHAYIGGSFTSVSDTHVKNIAEINTKTGAVVAGFSHHASAQVETLVAVGDRLLVGGYYTRINGSSANPYMTGLNPTTGRDDGFVHLNISGHYQFPGVAYNGTKVYNQALSHNGERDLVMGDFTSVGGVKRQQLFMLYLGGSQAEVTGWTSRAFAGHCKETEPFYVRAASWSPGDARIYIATTGGRTHGLQHGQYPLTGLCDAAAAFPAVQTTVKPLWINYTGCDSLYSTAADASTAYFGGHERWSMNTYGCGSKGRGAYNAVGMEGLSPGTGQLYLDKTNSAGYYERSRGVGADDMLVTKAGLWIASDNEGNSQTCGFVSKLSGICFLPYKHEPRQLDAPSTGVDEITSGLAKHPYRKEASQRLAESAWHLGRLLVELDHGPG
jgi:hypothetical protein